MRRIMIAVEAGRRVYSISFNRKNVETFYNSEVLASERQNLYAYRLQGKETLVANLGSSVTDDHEFIDFISSYKPTKQGYITKGGSRGAYNLDLYRVLRFATGLSSYTLLQYELEWKLMKCFISAMSAHAMLL